MRTAILTEFGDWSASTRFRALQHLPRLQQRLGTVDMFMANDRPTRAPGRVGQARYFASHGVRYLQRWSELRKVLDSYDAVLVQRGLYALGPGNITEPLESFKGRVVFDLDDAVFELKPSLQNKSRPTQWLYGPQQAIRVLRRADAVVVSTQTLADALPHRPSHVVVMPTVPDVSVYKVSDQQTVSPIIGWAGTNGGLPYLNSLNRVFAALAENNIGELEVVCSTPWDGPSTFRQWALEDEPTLFANFAVGIMPLPDTPYTRAKAGFKLLQYMAAGVPVVASPVGVNSQLIEESNAGFVADSPEDWQRQLTKLLVDKDLRAKLGTNGRNFVSKYADLNSQADTLANLLRGETQTTA